MIVEQRFGKALRKDTTRQNSLLMLLGVIGKLKTFFIGDWMLYLVRIDPDTEIAMELKILQYVESLR